MDIGNELRVIEVEDLEFDNLPAEVDVVDELARSIEAVRDETA